MKTKSWPIILNFTYVYAFELCLKKFPIMLNMMPIATAIVPQFIYNCDWIWENVHCSHIQFFNYCGS